ncbi:MAG: sensor domain-containing diguanylate cyclase [Alphaproteobacteria bacterium]|nr:sensor domain-containing diguanylate cyclase [Alphaproteobacteria bacterium]
MINTKLSDEPARLASLRRYDVLDTPADGVFEKITTLVRTVLKVPISAVSFVDSDRQWFKSIQGMAASEAPRAASFCSHAIMAAEPLVVADATRDARFRRSPLVVSGPRIRSYAGVPLRTPDGYNIGALCAMDTVPRTFDEEELDILARLAALVIDKLELRRIAERDPLTFALSRRGFIGQMEKEINRFERKQQPSVLAVMDLDHFRAVNDTFGHPTGDAVLKDVAATCIYQLRATDVFGRLGGEEFGILFSGTEETGARAAIEKIRLAIAEQIVPVAEGISVTASFGLAEMHSGIVNAEDWLAKAHQALLRAKLAGRNRCLFAVKPQAASGAQIIRLEEAKARRKRPHPR